MQIVSSGDNLDEISNPVETISMKYQILFLGKLRKTMANLSFVKLGQREVNIKKNHLGTVNRNNY